MKILLTLLTLGKLGKFLTTAGTMLLSVAAYALIWGWKYAVGFVVLIFIHEMGHYLAARARGLNVGVPVFIPFVGAWIQLDKMPHDAETEAFVGIAGPITGSTGAMVCYLLGRSSDSGLLLALAYSGFMLNLFNLIPLSPLDGGRITAVISPRIWLLGAPLLVALFFWKPSPLLLLIAIAAVPQLVSVLKGKTTGRYYEARLRQRLSYAVQYVGLVVFLAMIAFELHEQLASLHGARPQ